MHRTLRRTITAMKRWEKWLVTVLAGLLLLSFIMLLRQFYIASTESIPMRGGTYIEGSVGQIHMLNPWFTVTNDVNRDITSLIFAGLQRYNPFTGKVEDDLAELTISEGSTVYTLTLRDGIFWHDSTVENPRPVTADDIVFTYSTIKEQGFPNPILQKNFRGVDIEKIDDRTVQFRLEKPYFFFRSNLTLGILPKHHLDLLPPERLLDALDFNLGPIGCGPFLFKSIVENPLSTEVTLERNPLYKGSSAYIDRVVFRAFHDYPSLLSDLKNLDGVRHVPRDKNGKAIIPERYNTYSYSLPQYVALFFNLDRAILKNDKNLRLALQLATNKQEIVDQVNENVIIDTPLLEHAEEDWIYRFQQDAAEGALYDSDWHIPEKIRLQQLLEDRERNAVGALQPPQSVVYLATGGVLTFTGSYVPDSSEHLYVNTIPVTHISGTTATGTWAISLPTDGSSGSFILGRNAIKLTESGDTVIDTFILTRTADREEFKRLKAEEKIVDTFLERSDSGITIAHLLLDKGVLRLKGEQERYGIRRNERGEPLALTLLTSPLPQKYADVANIVAEQWRRIGVNVTVIVPKEKKEFETRILQRDYDVLLFGQPLLDNLDSYPYWHSSQIQVFKKDEEGIEHGQRLDANNLSQFTNFKADALLEQIRETRNEDLRKTTLQQLRTVFREEVPAIVLYSPTYVFAVSDKILGIDLGKPSLHSDRFLSLHRWFIKRGRTFQSGKSWFNFIPWLFRGGYH